MAIIQHKRSSTAAKVPLSTDLLEGELAVNTADGRVYVKKSDNSVVAVGLQTKSDLGLTNVDNTADNAKPVSTAQAAAIAQKANSASPSFTGTTAAPTPTAGDSSTQIATTAFVATAVAASTQTIDGGTF